MPCPQPPASPAKTATPGTTPAAGEADEKPKAPENKGLLPGFEGVFAIAGLLAVAYLAMRKRRTYATDRSEERNPFDAFFFCK
ncbi:MAG: PGF-CTERM sorting domain-containing protein, partial [Methanosarcinales archaeon]|nr:PGF-CTERM sorting domain-containing protein [Methanosarcinales archaeon]